MNEAHIAPIRTSAWALTVAAAFDQVAFVLLARADASTLVLGLFGICEVVLILGATYMWKSYFETLIQHKPHSPCE